MKQEECPIAFETKVMLLVHALGQEITKISVLRPWIDLPASHRT